MTLRQRRREARTFAVTKNFRNIYEADNVKSSCLWLPVNPEFTFSFFEELSDFPGLAGNGNIDGNNVGLDTSSDSSDDEQEA